MKVAFTIATANYLAQAKTLSESFLRHNSAYEFYIFLLDKIDGRFDSSIADPSKILEVEKLNIEDFELMVDRYSLFELCNALKPFVAAFLLREKNSDLLFYFDSDIFVYDSVEYAERLLLENNIVITPHFFTPLPLDDLKLSENDFLNTGVFNGGFFGLKKDNESLRFLNWWKERMRTKCIVDLANGLFVDQIWLNFLPLYFSGVEIIKHLGYNVAYWNLHERNLSNSKEVLLINKKFPIIFYHFSGYQLEKPDIISKFQNRYFFAARPDIEPLFQRYRETLLLNNHLQFSKLICFYISKKKQGSENDTDKSLGEEKILMKMKRILKRIIRSVFGV